MGRDGEKKYSPPFGTTQVGRESEVLWLWGSVPIIERVPPATCPMMGSIPEITGVGGTLAGTVLGGNVGVSAQPRDRQPIAMKGLKG